MMKKPITFDRADTCPICKAKRSIEGYLRTGDPIHLTLAIDKKADITKTDIEYLKCKNCKREFFPMWLDGYPTPMLDGNINDFMNSYKESYKKSEAT